MQLEHINTGVEFLAGKIIYSESDERTSPVASFVLSFIFTGLGQFHNGQLSKAIIFLMLRTFCILTPPFYSYVKKSERTYIDIVYICLIILAVIWLSSAAHASFLSFSKNNVLKQKKFFISHYIIFIFLNIVLIIFPLLIFFNSFAVIKVYSASAPVISRGDLVLIYKMDRNHDVIRDTMYLTDDGKILRAVLLENERMQLSSSGLSINKIEHELAVPDEEEISCFRLENYDILLQKSDKIKYPVISPLKKVSYKFHTSGKEFLLLSDNRRDTLVYKKLKKNNLNMRVEGILKKSGKQIYFPVKTYTVK